MASIRLGRYELEEGLLPQVRVHCNSHGFALVEGERETLGRLTCVWGGCGLAFHDGLPLAGK